MRPRQKVILLVEDNPDHAALTLRALKKANILNEVVVARDGVEALQVLFGEASGQSGPIVPGVVLLDLKLPRLDGFEVLRKLREDSRTRCLPVVILTTSNEDRDIVNGYRLGANSFIAKPVNYEKFNETVGQVGTYWMQLNEIAPEVVKS